VRVLLTGSAGFVGRRFQQALAEHDLTLVDLLDKTDARDFFRQDRSRFDLVVHLAAVVGGRAKIEGAPLELGVNLAIDAELFDWALRTRPGRIAYFSSSAAYPVYLQTREAHVPLREEDIDLTAPTLGVPDGTYGWAKLSGELLASYAEAEGIRVHVFRPFSGYGEDQDRSYPFRAFIERARERQDPFEIWGDGQQVRDWVHIDDVVEGALEAMRQDVPGPLNLCSGYPVSFDDLAETVCAIAGYSPEFRHLEDAPAGVAYRVGDPTRSWAVYRPQVSLPQGIERALR